MSHLRRHAVAYLALVVALGGTSYAAGYRITSVKQIAPKVREALQGERGPRGRTGADGVPGRAGFVGATGPAGVDGVDGADGLIARTRLNWSTQVPADIAPVWHLTRTLGAILKQRDESVLEVVVMDGSVVAPDAVCATQIRIDGRNDLGSGATDADAGDTGTQATLIAGAAATATTWTSVASSAGSQPAATTSSCGRASPAPAARRTPGRSSARRW